MPSEVGRPRFQNTWPPHRRLQKRLFQTCADKVKQHASNRTRTKNIQGGPRQPLAPRNHINNQLLGIERAMGTHKGQRLWGYPPKPTIHNEFPTHYATLMILISMS